MDKNESEDKKFLEEEMGIDEFDLEALIVEGKDARIMRTIEYFNLNTKQERKMTIYIRPVSHSEKERALSISKKDKTKSYPQLICAKGWVDPDGLDIELSKIKQVGMNVVEAVAAEIEKISGPTDNRFMKEYAKELANL